VLPEEGDFRPHPRNYRSFVKPLYDFVARRRLLTFEEAIRKATSMPAQKIGLFDRGILRPGMKADIALMDVPALGCDATYMRRAATPAASNTCWWTACRPSRAAALPARSTENC
jgi:N-acyl-D-aspartate/D-glutamate deacylase